MDSIADFDRSVGVAALISERAKDLHHQIEQLQASSNQLKIRLQDAEMPQVIVEGPTDVTILKHVYELLYPGQAPICEFISAGCASKVVSFILGLADLGRKYPFPIIGLLDDDNEGREQFKPSKQAAYKLLADTKLRVVDHLRGIYLGFLPRPAWVEGVESTLKAHRIDSPLPVTIETLVSKDFIAAAIAAGALSYSDEKTKAKNANFEIQVNLSDTLAKHLSSDERYFVQKIDEQSKTRFSTYFQANATLESCAGFRPIFVWLEATIRNFNMV